MLRPLGWMAAGSLLTGAGYFAYDELQRRAAMPHPVVLVHGLAGWAGQGKLAYFRDVPEFLEDELCVPVIVSEQDALAGIEHRGAQLAQQIRLYVQEMRREYGRRLKVDLICHSMGGLDARVAVHLLTDNEVATITTISTPHRGSALAKAVEDLPAELAGLADLSVERMADFDVRFPDVPGVQYYSVAGAEEVPLAHPLFFLQRLLERSEPPPSDGLVSVASARHGVFLGQEPLNHWSEIGWLCRKPGEHLDMYRRIHANIVANRV